MPSVVCGSSLLFRSPKQKSCTSALWCLLFFVPQQTHSLLQSQLCSSAEESQLNPGPRFFPRVPDRTDTCVDDLLASRPQPVSSPLLLLTTSVTPSPLADFFPFLLPSYIVSFFWLKLTLFFLWLLPQSSFYADFFSHGLFLSLIAPSHPAPSCMTRAINQPCI